MGSFHREDEGFNQETLDAIEEYRMLRSGMMEGTVYHSVKEMFEDILGEE
jgi:hypothetical protein